MPLATQEPRVVCGMTIIPADPTLDSQMLMQVPTDKNYTMRLIPPPECRDMPAEPQK